MLFISALNPMTIHISAYNVKFHILHEGENEKNLIILESIPDWSKTEQMSFIVRYASIEQKTINIHKYF